MSVNRPIKSNLCECGKSIHCRNMCKNCYDKWLKINNPEYRERQLKQCKEWISANYEKYKDTKNQWIAKQDPKYMKEYKRIKKLATYGITPEDYDKMLIRQNNVCAICYGDNKGKTLHVDHCHNTGIVRGLLCFRCNFGLSYFSEDSEKMLRASKYLAAIERMRDDKKS